MRAFPTLALLTMVSCRGCAGCFVPQLPDNQEGQETDSETETDSASDSGDSGDTEDTGPPPPCAFPEEEPNNNNGQAQEIEMEGFACGYFENDRDWDMVKFTTTEAGWLRAWPRANDIGSSSDLALQVYDAAGEYAAVGQYQLGTTDPLLVIPVEAGVTLYAALSEQYQGFGEHYEWEFLATMTKQPVSWNLEEEEPNNDASEPDEIDQLIEDGDTVFGTIRTGGDWDWFHLDVPEGKTALSFALEAWNYGSPLDGQLRLVAPDGEILVTKTVGQNSSDQDPSFEYTVDEAGQYLLLVRAADGVGSPSYWYTLVVQQETDPVDTGTE